MRVTVKKPKSLNFGAIVEVCLMSHDQSDLTVVMELERANPLPKPERFPVETRRSNQQDRDRSIRMMRERALWRMRMDLADAFDTALGLSNGHARNGRRHPSTMEPHQAMDVALTAL